MPAKQGQKKVTRQTRNKSGEGNKFKTDGGKQTPHVHDRNHGKKRKNQYPLSSWEKEIAIVVGLSNTILKRFEYR